MQEQCTNYILVAEDPIGEIIICEEYEDRDKALRAFNRVFTPKVTLYRQDCRTVIVAQSIKKIRTK